MPLPSLSKTMKAALDFADANGGIISRFPGGFWSNAPFVQGRNAWFGTTTIEALVSRGVLEYSKWQESPRPSARFPIEAKKKEGK